MNILKRSLFATLLFVTLTYAAAPTYVENGRVHTATQIAFNAGANGCAVTGVTAATPAVITCANTHNLQDGDQVQVTGVGGTTTVNTTAFAKVTGYSTTTFGLYTTAALTTGVTGTGSYTSGGAVSEATDVSALTLGSWTLRLKVEFLTAGATVSIAIQDSTDGFVSDIKTLQTFSVNGSVTAGSPIEKTWREYEIPNARIGVASARIRVLIQSLTAGASVVTSLLVQ